MCTYGSLLFFFFLKGSIYYYLTPWNLKWIITAMIFSFSFILPVINIYILYRLNRISSLKMENQSERTFPYVLTSCFYFGLFYLFLDLNIWPGIKVLIFGGGVTILLTAIINMKYKISAHMVGIGGLLGSLMVIANTLKYNATSQIIILVLIAGIIATARLYLKAHEPRQIYSGFFLGLITQVLVFFGFLYFNLIQ
jgi:hypothetical protein